MAVDAKAYQTPAAITAGAVPLIYGQNVIRKLYENDIMRGYMEDVSVLLGAGNTWQVPVENSVFAMGELTEGTATPISELAFGKKDLTVKWYGDAKQWTVELDANAFSYVLNNNRENAAAAIGVNRDNQLIATLTATTSDAVYPYKDASTKYTSSDIAATAVLSYEQIMSTRVTMRLNGLKLKYVFAHPEQILSLSTDVRIVNNTNYNANVMERGELRTVGGIQIIEHPSITSVTENSLKVYIALGTMEKPAFYAQKKAPVFELDAGRSVDRAMTFHYYEAFGSLIKRDAGVIPMKSVGSVL